MKRFTGIAAAGIGTACAVTPAFATKQISMETAHHLCTANRELIAAPLGS